MKKIIDVSQPQGKIDWAQVAPAGFKKIADVLYSFIKYLGSLNS